MPLDVPTDSYLALEEFKIRVNITDSKWDTALESVLKAASRQIDRWTGRFFYQLGSDDTPAVRYFTPYFTNGRWGFYGTAVEPGDLVSLDSLAADDSGNATWSTLWDSSDLLLLPVNASSLDKPYTLIGVGPNTSQAFPVMRNGVKVTGVFGWPAVPDAIKEATFLQAHRLWKRQSAPFGIVGSAELGQLRAITSTDPDVKALVGPYKVKTL